MTRQLSLNRFFDIGDRKQQYEDRHNDGAGAAEAELQIFDAVGVQILGDGRRAVCRAATGQKVYFIKDTEGIDRPE